MVVQRNESRLSTRGARRTDLYYLKSRSYYLNQ